MKQFLLIMFLVYGTISYASFVGINSAQLQEKIDQKVVVIDIRPPEEWKFTGVVPTSKKVMFFTPNGTYDVQAWLNKLSMLIEDQNTAFVLVCRTGSRTGVVGDFLSKQLKFKNVYHLEHGIVSWIQEGRKTTK